MRHFITLYRVILLCSIGLLSNYSARAQGSNHATNDTEQRQANPAKARPGTYLFIVEPGGEQEVFTDDVLIIAEQLRREHETIRYQLSAFVTIEILSRDEVRSQQHTSYLLTNDESERHEK
ncbi:MAG: hypothetical protein ACKOQ6_11040 [Bacteroidota bacterium]